MNIGAKIREARKAQKLTQKQFAELIGKSGQVVSNWERQYTPRISYDDVIKIETVLKAGILSRHSRASINFNNSPVDSFIESFTNLSPGDQARVLVFIDALAKTKPGTTVFFEEGNNP